MQDPSSQEYPDSIFNFVNLYGPFFLFREGFWYFSFGNINLRKDEHGNNFNSIMRQGEVLEEARRTYRVVECPH